ncbi:MAG: MEDS domain-containing protein [Candidatus Zixiibacteriota bacterium]|nr:MAG: MEDS domain-containing protein [candidate division Zixibacteria bacterium]
MNSNLINLQNDSKKSKNYNHIGHFYSSKDEQLSVLVDYIKSGLEQEEKCVFISRENGSDVYLEKLKGRDISIEAALGNGDLILENVNEMYLRRGFFDPDYIIKRVERYSDLAGGEGYKGLRIAGEMSWIGENRFEWDKLMEYETRLNIFIPKRNITSLCQYDMKGWSWKWIIQVIHSHPKIIYNKVLRENEYYILPSEFLQKNNADYVLNGMLEKIVRGDSPEGKIFCGGQAALLRDRMLNRQLNEWEKTLEVFKESESYFRKLVNSAPVALIVTDTSGRCLFANEYWQALSCLTLQDSIGIGWQKVIHSEDVGRIGSWWYPGEKKHTDVATECRIVTSGGKEKLTDLKSAPLYDDNGSRIGFIVVFAEVTHRKNDKYNSINRIPALTDALEVK